MNISFYTAAIGAREQQQRLNVQANNIANVNTYGFKAEKPSFESLLYSTIGGIDGAELPRGGGARINMTKTDFVSGPLISTGRIQDYAINGSGFFALYDPKSEEISYSRDGSFTLSEFLRPREDEAGAVVLDEAGQPEMETVWRLADGNGRFVLGEGGGVIEVKDAGARQAVGVFDFVNTDGMIHVGGNRFVPVEKNGQVRLGTGKLVQSSLEGSNADLATELSKVIEAQRSFSYALKMVQTSDEIETTVNNLRG